MVNSNIRCALASINPYPIGNVATLRYSSYMRSIAAAGCFAKVYIYAPSRTAKSNTQVSGEHNGVYYQYTSGKISLKYRNILTMLWYLILGLINSWRYIVKDKINVLILYGENPCIINLFFKLLCRCNGIKYLGDRSEYPHRNYVNNFMKRWLYAKKIGWFDGMIIMTDELKEYYSGFLHKPSAVYMLPMTIDCHRFDNLTKIHTDYQYIAVVFGVHNRDGLLESIRAFNRYRVIGGRYHLVLIGDYNRMPNKDSLDLEIEQGGYKTYIHILGLVDNNQLPQKLINASCLMTTPNSYVSGGFPTKLGEYMLSGVPIVATIAGDVLKYVKPNEEILFSNPSDIKSIAENLLCVQNNREQSENMALRAKAKAQQVFNANTYTESIIRFFAAP